MNPVGSDWRVLRAEAEAHAAARLAADPALAAAMPGMVCALEEILAEGPEEGAELLQMLGDKVGERLISAGCADWANALGERLKTGNQVADARLTTIELAIGRAAGEFCGRNPGELEPQLIRRVLEALPGSLKEFDAAAEAALRETPAAQDVLASTLRQRASNFLAAPHEMAFMYPVEPALFIERASQRLINSWEGSPASRAPFVHDLDAYDLLRRVDPEAYLEVLESLPHPDLARQVFSPASRVASVNELCLLLQQAGRAFGADGKWLADSKAPFLLLAACTERLSAIAAEPPLDGDQVGDAGGSASGINEMMSEILDALAARPDAVALGYAWLHYLIWSGHARARWRPRNAPANAAPTGLLTVLGQLGAWLPWHVVPEKWVAEELDLWRNDRIYSLLTVAVSHNPIDGSKIGDLVASLLAQDLASSFGIERLARDSGSHERQIVGLAVAAIPEPAKWFRELWAKLFQLRDRARRYRLTCGYVAPKVGQVAVIWGLCGLGGLDFKSEPARLLWTELELAARESVLTDAIRLHEDPWCAAARWLAAYWPRIFPEDPPAGSVGSLDDFVSFWAAPDNEFAMLVLELRQQGVTPAQLKRSIPEGELLRRGADVLDRMRGVDPESKIASAIRKLADEIDQLKPTHA